MPTRITESDMYGTEYARSIEVHMTDTAVFINTADSCMEFERIQFELAIMREQNPVPTVVA